MTNCYRLLLGVLLSVVAGSVACGSEAQRPSVEILSPPSGSQISLGQEVEVQYRASDAAAVIRVDLEVEGEVVDSQKSPVSEGQPTMNGVLRWLAEEAGTHTLILYAYNADRVASDPVGVSVTVGAGQTVPGATATISLLMHGGTQTPEDAQTPDSSTTVPQVTATTPATQPPATPSPSPTVPPPVPTATQPPPPPTATQGPVPARIELINNSGEEVYYVHFASPFHNFGGDQLGSDTVYAANNYIFHVYAGRYRLQAVAGDGYVLDDRSGVGVSGHYEWVVPQTRQFSPEPVNLTVYNYCSEDIGRLYIYQPSDSGKGPNQIGNPIPPNGSEVFSLHPGWWATTAENAQGAHLDHMNAMEFLAGDSPMWNACAVG